MSRCSSRSSSWAGERAASRAAASSIASGRSSSRRADLAHRVVDLELGPDAGRARAKSPTPSSCHERWNRVLVLAAEVQQLPARDQQLEVRARLEHGHVRRRIGQLLEVVEQEEQLACRGRRREPVAGPRRLGTRPMTSAGSRSGASAPRRRRPGTRRRRSPRPAARAASYPSRRARQREQADVVTREKRATSASSRSRPTNDVAGIGQVRLIKRLQRRELPVTELEDALRRREILEAMLAEIADGTPSSRRPRVVARDTTWPPCAELMIRAASGRPCRRTWGDRGRALRCGCRRGSGSGRVRDPPSPRTRPRRRLVPRRRRRRRRLPRSRPRSRVPATGLADDPAVLGEGIAVGVLPSSSRSSVEPSMSVKTSVTVPEG